MSRRACLPYLFHGILCVQELILCWNGQLFSVPLACLHYIVLLACLHYIVPLACLHYIVLLTCLHYIVD